MDVEAFDRELRAAADLFGRGELQQAEAHVAQAIALRPGHPLAQHLMALILFRGGQRNRACDILELLAQRNGQVVPLQFNAGVAALEAQQWEQAGAHLRRAVELDPTHRRAFAYLALTHVRAGQSDLARAALLEAELPELAEELDPERIRTAADAMRPPRVDPYEGFVEIAVDAPDGVQEATDGVQEATDGVQEATDGVQEATDGVQEATDGVQEATEGVQEATGDEIDASLRRAFDHAFGERQEATPDGSSAAAARVSSAPSDDVHRPVDGLPGGASGQDGSEPSRPPPPLAAERGGDMSWQPMVTATGFSGGSRRAISIEPARGLVEFARLELPRRRVEIDGGRLALALRGEPVYFRLDRLRLTSGAIQLLPVSRRAKGAWGERLTLAGQPVVAARGEGGAWLAADPGERLELLSLADEAIYLRECCIVAFSDGLRWANGRVPGSAGQLHALELAGSGFVALCCRRALVAVSVAQQRPVTVLASRLVAWSGALVPEARSGPADDLLVECQGDGVVLVGLDGGDQVPRADAGNAGDHLAG